MAFRFSALGWSGVIAVLFLVSLAGSSAKAAEMDPILVQLRERLPADALIAASTTGDFAVGVGEGASKQMVPAGDGVPFKQACEVTVSRSFERTFDVCGHSTPLAAAIPRGNRVLASLWLRAPKMTGGRTGTVIICLEKTQAPWTAVTNTSATIGPEWRQIILQGTTAMDYPANGLHLSVHLSTQQQIVELAGAAIVDLGSFSDVAHLPTNTVTWAGQEPDAPWRAEARHRIEQYRMAPLRVTVTDADGKPLAGVPVEVKQRKRAFTIGSCTISTGRNIVQSNTPDGERLRSFYPRLFDRATIPLYWADWGWPGRRTEWVKLARWAQDLRLELHGHPLIYPNWENLPSEMRKLAKDPVAMQARMLAQIREVGQSMQQAGIVFNDIDVTNELRDLTEVPNILGKKAVAEWFAEARKAFPGTKLCLNENTILENDGNTLPNQQNLLDWYRYLDSQGQAPDLIGFQGHFGESVTGAVKVWSILDRFAESTRAQFLITEFDLNTTSDALQAGYLRDFMTACFAHPRVTAFTFWGFQESDHWIPQAALWRKDWSERPAAAVLEQLNREWTTNAQVKTNDRGEAEIGAFLGELTVTVRPAAAQPIVQQVKLPEAGKLTQVAVQLKP